MSIKIPNLLPIMAIAFAVLLFDIGASQAQEESQSTNLVDTVLSEAIAAVGNDTAVSSIDNLTASANCQGPQGEYQTDIISFSDRRTIFRQTFSYKDEPTLIKINGLHGWSVDSVDEKATVITPFHRLVVKLHEFQKLTYAFKDFFTEFQVIGEEVFADRVNIKVKAKHELGGEIFLMFDKNQKRLAGYVLPLPGTHESVINTFSDWDQVGGLMLPRRVTAVDGSGTWTMKFGTIELNEAKPGDCKIPNRVLDVTELLRLQKQAQTAHLSYDAELFVEMFADQLTEISAGQVKTQSRSDNLKRFKHYFETYEFEKWEDLEPPAITLSGDGTMATVIVQKLVSGRPKHKDDQAEFRQTRYAWIEVWEKNDGSWKVVSIASTTKPNSE